jgi:mono/diheme cytochrome c family protein
MGMLGRLMAAGVIASAIGFAAAAAPEKAGNPVEGRRLALKICAWCHVVAADQEFPPALRMPVPSFQVIANKPDAATGWLRQFLVTTHSTIAEPAEMPNPRLSDDQVDDIVSYILSLRSTKTAPRRAE